MKERSIKQNITKLISSEVKEVPGENAEIQYLTRLSHQDNPNSNESTSTSVVKSLPLQHVTDVSGVNKIREDKMQLIFKILHTSSIVVRKTSDRNYFIRRIKR